MLPGGSPAGFAGLKRLGFWEFFSARTTLKKKRGLPTKSHHLSSGFLEKVEE
jgi:hypothetical protein